MKLQDIKDAIAKGEKVQYFNKRYEVIKDNIDQYMIHDTVSNNYIGLYDKYNILNGSEADFKIIKEVK